MVKEAYPDHTQFDPAGKYYDEKSSSDNPHWFMPDVKFVSKFKEPITLEQLKQVPGLENMVLLKKRSRLSVQPVTPEE